MKRLLAILVLALSLRLWQITDTPPGLTWDEAALGYNGYSILRTGKDEYGKFLPLQLKSFGDYKPALYSYLTIPFITSLGLNELSVRLPVVIIGVLAVLLCYLLAQELFGNQKLSLSSALMLAISPWHIQFTRPAYEASVGLFLNLLGLWLFMKGVRKKSWLIAAAVTFGLSVYTYQASRLFVPIILAGLVWLNRQNLRLNKLTLTAAVIFGVVCLPLLINVTYKGEGARLATLNFFAYTRKPTEVEIIAREDGLSTTELPSQIIHGEWWSYLRGLTERYLIYFSPKRIFIDGDYNPRQRVPEMGIVLYYDLIFLSLGIIWLISKNSLASKIILGWLLLAPIPAVLSRDLISSLRALNMVFPLAILSGIGLYLLLTQSKTWLKIGVIGLMLFNFGIYLDSYYIHAPKEYSQGWLYGNKQVVEFLKTRNLSQYDKIVFDDFYGQPYIYYLFYSGYDPDRFQKQAILDQPTVDVGTVRKIDNIEFRSIYWPKDRGIKNSLFIGTNESLPERDIVGFKEFNLLNEVKFLDGTTAFRIVETTNEK